VKRRPPIYGIGWSDPDGGPDTADVTVSYLGDAQEPLALALAEAVGHGGGSAAYPLPSSAVATLPRSAGTDLLQDMVEDECAIVVMFSTDQAPTEDARVGLLRDVHDSGRADVVYGEAHWWPADDSVDPFPLIELWAERWPDSLPIAHELKELFEDRWVRFHTVPGGRRTPAVEADWAEVMRRYNDVLGELATEGEELLVIMSVVSAAPEPAEHDLDFWTSVPWHYADPDLLFAHLFVTTSKWRPGAVDDLFRLAAEQQIGGVIMAPADLSWLFHPYAGGADVIVRDRVTRNALGNRFDGWTSTHPSGL